MNSKISKEDEESLLRNVKESLDHDEKYPEVTSLINKKCAGGQDKSKI